MTKGWFKIHRQFFDHEFWNEDRIYSRAEAWIDLIGSSQIEARDVTIKGRDIEVQTGELVVSNRYLQKRWGWSNSKVSKFLRDLKKKGMIDTKNDSGCTVLTLIKYRVYQNKGDTKNDTKSDSEATPKRQRKRIEERKESFKERILTYSTIYQREMLLKFFDYWSEHNENGKKMRFEMQKTFDVEKRLRTWHTNQQKWEKEKNVAPKKEKLNAGELIKQKYAAS